MKKHTTETPVVWRAVALALLVVFTFTSCVGPFSPESPETGNRPAEPVITPGEGDVRYVFLDANYHVSDTDSGRLGLFVENNKNAEGAMAVAESANDYEDKVSIFNAKDKSAVIMYFRKDKNFPHRMGLLQKTSAGDKIYTANVSEYNRENQTYSVAFWENGYYESLDDIVLNRSIIDTAESISLIDNDDQNNRLRRILITLGVYGSLAAQFEKADDPRFLHSTGRGIFGGFTSACRRVSSCFKSVGSIALTVATWVAPLASFINPIAGLVVAGIGLAVAGVSYLIAAVADFIADVFETIDTMIDSLSFQLPELDSNGPMGPMAVIVKYAIETPSGTERANGVLVNGNRQREGNYPPANDADMFHVGKGETLVLKFTGFGLDNSVLPSREQILRPGTFEPVRTSANSNNVWYTTSLVTSGLPNDQFHIRIRRSSVMLDTDYVYDGRSAWGIRFTEQPILVNESTNNVWFKSPYLPGGEAVTSHNIISAWTCINATCPNYHP